MDYSIKALREKNERDMEKIKSDNGNEESKNRQLDIKAYADVTELVKAFYDYKLFNEELEACSGITPTLQGNLQKRRK